MALLFFCWSQQLPHAGAMITAHANIHACHSIACAITQHSKESGPAVVTPPTPPSPLSPHVDNDVPLFATVVSLLHADVCSCCCYGSSAPALLFKQRCCRCTPVALAPCLTYASHRQGS
jgi:hypothetical protein